MREEVWAIVRAAINEATQPMLSKQRELEERVVRAEQAAAAAASAGLKTPSIPVSASIAPDSVTNPNYRPPQKAMRLSVPPGVYGVAVIDPGDKKPDIDMSNVGPIHDMPNFGGGGKKMGRIIAIVMVLLVVAAIVSMIASRA